jgi:hypothetical protein
LIAAGVGLCAFIGLAIAQTVPVPQVSVLHPTDLFQVIPFGQPTSGNVYTTPAEITSQFGYVKYNTSAISAGTYTFANSQAYLTLTPGTTISTLTVILAANPSDGARECIWSNSIISTLVVAANTGQTINGAVTSLSAAAGACYLYSASNLTWDRT